MTCDKIVVSALELDKCKDITLHYSFNQNDPNVIRYKDKDVGYFKGLVYIEIVPSDIKSEILLVNEFERLGVENVSIYRKSNYVKLRTTYDSYQIYNSPNEETLLITHESSGNGVEIPKNHLDVFIHEIKTLLSK
jgi:hypothetical protein